MPRVFIKKFRNLLEVSRDGTEPLADAEYDLLLPAMEYTQLVTLHGRAARDENGDYRPIQQVRKRLYWWDQRGRLLCGKGYLDRLEATFRGLRYTIAFQDRTPPGPRPDALRPRWENLAGEHFRPLQRECVERVAERVAQGRGGIIKAVPGVGKSHLIRAMTLLYPKAKICISVPDIDNSNKTFLHLVDALPNIGMVGGGQHTQRRVTLYTQGSLHHMPDDADIVIVDEVHKYAAAKTSEVLGRVTRNAFCLGLSATPTGRLDRQDAKLEPLFGPVVFEVTWAQAISHGLVVPITVRWHDVLIRDDPCLSDNGNYLRGVAKKRHGVWRNQPRNRVVAQVARSYPAGEQTLVMCQFAEHALFLKKTLPEFELVYAVSSQDRLDEIAGLKALRKTFAGAAPEAMTRERRENMRVAFEKGTLKKVIVNDVWSTGVSFNRLQALVRADARSNDILDEQIPGRVSRVHEESGKTTGFLDDFLDQFNAGMQRQAQERRRNYREKGWYEVMPPKVGALDHRLGKTP